MKEAFYFAECRDDGITAARDVRDVRDRETVWNRRIREHIAAVQASTPTGSNSSSAGKAPRAKVPSRLTVPWNRSASNELQSVIGAYRLTVKKHHLSQAL